MDFEPVIGIEIHAQLKTKSKMFSSAPVSFGDRPNSNVAPLDIAFPGALPTVNKEAIIYAIRVCHALNMKIDDLLVFDRKNYFYSDLPKGYQLTQYFRPIGKDGYLTLKSNIFDDLLQLFNRSLDPQILYKGYRLLAADGSDIHYPTNLNEPENYFKVGEAYGYNLIHLNALYDIKSGIYTDAVIQMRRQENEAAAVVQMVERSNIPKAIVLMDRGYESSFWSMHPDLTICPIKQNTRSRLCFTTFLSE